MEALIIFNCRNSKIEKRIKNLNYKYTKMKYNNEGIGIIFENVEEYYNYNKINIPEWYNCKCNMVNKND